LNVLFLPLFAKTILPYSLGPSLTATFSEKQASLSFLTTSTSFTCSYSKFIILHLFLCLLDSCLLDFEIYGVSHCLFDSLIHSRYFIHICRLNR
jgi:hypothetical protein